MDVRLKLETLQPTFSYKVRGAFNAVLRLAEEGGATMPLVTASAGNHGRALAHAAAVAGLDVIVYVSEHAPQTKLDAISATGAELRICHDHDEAERAAKARGRRRRAVHFTHNNHPDVIAGLEALGDPRRMAEVDDRGAGGGGGLISGIAVVATDFIA
jgi:threonine dehydratase